MNRVEFTNTKKKMRKGYWIQQTPSSKRCPDCNTTLGISVSMSNCKTCGGDGYVKTQQHRYSVENGLNTKTTLWNGNCPLCGNATRKFIRTGKCDCETAPCSHCHGKRCRQCNFRGRL